MRSAGVRAPLPPVRGRPRPALLLVALAALLAPAHADPVDDELLVLELGRTYDGDTLARAARSDDAATRRAAARAGARLKDRRALPWLLPLLEDEVGPVRRMALFALGQIGTAEVVVPLRAALPGLGREDLPFALEALGKTRDPRAVAEVALRLGHGETEVRGRAALALARLADAGALPEVFAALALEREADARWRLVYAAWILLRERARATGDPVAADAAWTAGLRQAAAVQRPFAERIFALRALGSVAGQREWLLEWLSAPDVRIIVAAVRATARPFDAACARRVAALAAHKNALVREAVVDHLAAGGADAADLLAEAAGKLTSHPRLYCRAQVALAAVGREIAFLEPGSDGGDALREETLWRIAAHLPAKLPADAPRTVRGRTAAADACGNENVPRARALALLRELLETDDFVVRATAIASLGARGAAEQAPAIVAAARAAPGSGLMDVRIEAANALAAMGVADDWLVTAATEDPDAPVRDAARAALEKLGQPVPPAAPATGFRLQGHDAKGVREAARALRGARLVMETTRGRIVAQLFPDEAPAHCVNLATLANGGFYDGLTWHRVVANFVIQGGCPRGDGAGGPGYAIPDEIGLRAYVRGTVGMPKAGDDTGGCQIFITHLPTPHLDGRYTVFAQVVEGFAAVDAIRVGDRILKARVELRAAGDR